MYLSRQFYIHIYAFLLYTHTFLIDKLYIQTLNNKKSLVFPIKIMLNGDFL